MEYVFVNKPEFDEPIRVLFICGSSYRDASDDKRIVIKEFLELDPKNRVVILEKYFNFKKSNTKNEFLNYFDAELFDLFHIENLAALIAHKVIIIHESISTAGEIGVFASNKQLRNNIITISPERYSIEEEKISNFLRLAFWPKQDFYVINKDVIRYYPEVKNVFISPVRSAIYTYFPNNKVPTHVGEKLNLAIGEQPTLDMSIHKTNYYENSQYNVSYYLNGNSATARMTYQALKNYVLAILSVSEFRQVIYKCNKLFELRDAIKKWLLDILKQTISENCGYGLNKLKIKIVGQNEMPLDTILNFLIYMLHACELIQINTEENGEICIHGKQNTSKLFEVYSGLINRIEPMKWGE